MDEVQELVDFLADKQIDGVTVEEDSKGVIYNMTFVLTTGEEFTVSGARGDGALNWMMLPKDSDA